jgi:hypothetical protein
MQVKNGQNFMQLARRSFMRAAIMHTLNEGLFRQRLRGGWIARKFTQSSAVLYDQRDKRGQAIIQARKCVKRAIIDRDQSLSIISIIAFERKTIGVFILSDADAATNKNI